MNTMPITTINVRVPQVTSIEMAIRLYYERTELSNPEIKALFGTGNNTVCKLNAADCVLSQCKLIFVAQGRL